MACKQNDLLLESLTKYYNTTDPNKIQKIFQIIGGDSYISLRIIDWFVTNYAKQEYTTYMLSEAIDVHNNPIEYISYNVNNNLLHNIDMASVKHVHKVTRINVYNDYKLKLKAYSKKRFDPFCRHTKIQLAYHSTSLLTTLGQINFFKWVIDTHMIDYIELMYKQIEYDMNHRLKSDTSDKQKKRKELSISATKGIKKEMLEIVVDFGTNKNHVLEYDDEATSPLDSFPAFRHSCLSKSIH